MLIKYENLDEGPLPDRAVLGDRTPMYHKHRGLAENERDRILAVYSDRITNAKVEFEPNNGWVIVLFSKVPHDLDELSDRFEIRDGVKRPKPEYRNRISAPLGPVLAKTASKTPVPTGESAPSGGKTARVWAIADAKLAKIGRAPGKEDRADIIRQCESEGINPATAATQYSKWKRSKGL